MSTTLLKHPAVIAGAVLAIAVVAWYVNYSSPYERCVRAAMRPEKATHVLTVKGVDGTVFEMEWFGTTPTDAQIDEAFAMKKGGEKEPIRYYGPQAGELDALTRCAGLR